MSQPRLHDQLNVLFSERNSQNLKLCLEHPDYAVFQNLHGLNIPLSEFVLAFTHTSFSHEYQAPHQELAEFFGDAVVQLIVTSELMRLYPHEKEGRLSKLRSSIVNEKTLAKVANYLKLGDLILVGRGEYKKELNKQDAVLADTFEALMSSIYKHQGMDVAASKLLTWLTTSVSNVFQIDNVENHDSKSKLQEATLAKYKSLPRYSADAEGANFLVKLYINDQMKAQGVFPSKKTGERELAKQVLENKDF